MSLPVALALLLNCWAHMCRSLVTFDEDHEGRLNTDCLAALLKLWRPRAYGHTCSVSTASDDEDLMVYKQPADPCRYLEVGNMHTRNAVSSDMEVGNKLMSWLFLPSIVFHHFKEPVHVLKRCMSCARAWSGC